MTTTAVTSLDFSALHQLALQRAQASSSPRVQLPQAILPNLVPLDRLIANRIASAPSPLPARPLTLAPQPAPANSLGFGDSGQAVTHIQQRLQKWGYTLKADGDYGSQTTRVVGQFQRDQGLPDSGRVNQPTLQALEKTPQLRASLSEIRAGRIQIGRGAQGDSVSYIQQRLGVWGYAAGRPDGDFGPRTQSAVKAFQQAQHIQVTGQVGQTTLAALDKTPVTAGRLQTNSDAVKLARTAQTVAARRDTVGWCYSGVATAVSKALGVELYGKSAYQASGILARSDDFEEITALRPSDLPKLPAGAIVVWGKTGASPNGHISVALGNGREASDHIAQQLTNLRGHTNFRVFMPVA